MTYSRHRPGDDLALLVESVWVQEAPASAVPPPPTTVLPIGRPEMLVHFGDPFEHWNGQRFVRVPASYVMGQRSRPLRVRATGRTGLVLASLQPWAALVVFGASLASAGDECVALEDLVGRQAAARLGERVGAATGPRERVAVVDAFLRATARDRAPDQVACEAAHRINRGWGGIRIAALSRDLGISRRQLERRFSLAVGASPKRFARIVRAQKALGLLRQGVGSLDVAFRCGYADQSHLLHELADVAGRTAGALASPAQDTPLKRTFNARGVSHFYNTVYL
jgi:AraC-like DNA-binding protein